VFLLPLLHSWLYLWFAIGPLQLESHKATACLMLLNALQIYEASIISNATTVACGGIVIWS
jgi:hypothetical protein